MQQRDYDRPNDSTGHERSVSDTLTQQKRGEWTKDSFESLIVLEAHIIYNTLREQGEVNVRVRGTEKVFQIRSGTEYGMRWYSVVVWSGHLTLDGMTEMRLNKADALEWFRELEMIVEF